ncbi:SH3 domain-containing kinase-binding protein 1-like [Lytechinus pictus]|uniref:SH3 domain-containing kinase-binding protein 1-like n=1 Tax=Lytechinus pictus TaxID=7653 RepID=UPI0030B9FC90
MTPNVKTVKYESQIWAVNEKARHRLLRACVALPKFLNLVRPHVEAVVEFDYDAVNGDELTLRKGDIIKDINRMEGGWWEGVLHTQRGMFPDNFVKIIEKTSSTQKSTAASTASASTTPSLSSSSSMKSHGQGPVANGDVSLGSQEMGDDAKVKKRGEIIIDVGVKLHVEGVFVY